jgi:AcrR family transcriptional regulator
MAEATRARIVAAAVDEFLEKGYEAAFTRDIARRAGLSEALVFKYFRTKEALYIAAFDELLARHEGVAGEPGEAGTPSPLAWLRTFALGVLEAGPADALATVVRKGLLLQLEHFTADNQAESDIEAVLLAPVIARAQAAGEVRADVSAAALAGVYWRFLVGCVSSEANYPKGHPEQWVEGFVGLLQA